MKRKQIIIISIIAGMIAVILPLSVAAGILIHFFRLPNMEGGVVYKDHTYAFMTSERYGYSLTKGSIKTKKAIGRFDDAIIYTIADDPDEFYLYPRVFLPHASYNLLCRTDGFPSPDDAGNVDYMEIYVKNEAHGEDDAYRELKVTEEIENSIIDAIQKHDILTENWKETNASEIAVLTIHFCQPNGLYFQTGIFQYKGNYGLLLDDDKTLVSVSWEQFETAGTQE